MVVATILAIIAGVIFLVWGWRKGAIGGGATLGFIVGLVLALVKHNWGLLALSFAIGVFAGVGAELLGMLGDSLKRKGRI
jgi:hypothetical protein